MSVKLERTKESAGRAWRAVVNLPDFMKLPGVTGSLTVEGPWAEGYGWSAQGAYDEALRTIGRFVVEATPLPTEETPEVKP